MSESYESSVVDLRRWRLRVRRERLGLVRLRLGLSLRLERRRDSRRMLCRGCSRTLVCVRRLCRRVFESFSRCFVLVNHLGGCSVWFCSSSEVGGGDGGINLGSDPGGDGGIHASAPMLVIVFVCWKEAAACPSNPRL